MRGQCYRLLCVVCGFVWGVCLDALAMFVGAPVFVRMNECM